MLCNNELKIVLEFDKVIVSRNYVFVQKYYSYDGHGMLILSISEINIIFSHIIEHTFVLWHDSLGNLNYILLQIFSKKNIRKNLKFVWKQKY